jgi:hypothetical protein
MTPKSMGLGESSTKPAIERPNLSETAMQASGLIITLVQEAATLAPCAELKEAATVALIIFNTIQVYNNFNLVWPQ